MKEITFDTFIAKIESVVAGEASSAQIFKALRFECRELLIRGFEESNCHINRLRELNYFRAELQNLALCHLAKKNRRLSRTTSF